MAYMDRGEISSGSGPSEGFEHNDNNDKTYYGSGIFRLHYYVPLDNTYVIFQMIATFIIFVAAGITILATYKPSIIDPIESTKGMVLNTYIIITVALLAITLLANHFSKDKNALIKRLSVLLIISILTMLVFFGIKMNLDSTYTKSKFEQIYTLENGEQTSNTKSRFDIGLTTGMKMKTEKEYYVDECLKAYNVFSIRMYGAVGLNILLIILLIYQVIRVSKIQEKRDRLSKDDVILFDEEENVKF